MNVVVSQPMFFPWLGLFEQVRLADIFVHYNDVQLPLGRSFMSRVQIKTPAGTQWLTAPVRRRAGQRINETVFDDANEWRAGHLATLTRCYAEAPAFKDMIRLAQDAYRNPTSSLAEFNIAATEMIAATLGLHPRFRTSSSLGIAGSSSHRLLSIVKELGGSSYLTGHGAAQYLDHDLFAAAGIEVRYMNYQCKPYPQLFGEFTPYVTILDAIANLGQKTSDWLVSETVSWRDFVK